MENTGPRIDQVVPTATPRYGAATHRWNQPEPRASRTSVRPSATTTRLRATFSRFPVFARGSVSPRLKTLIAGRKRAKCAVGASLSRRGVAGARRRRRRRRRRFYRSHAERQRACAYADALRMRDPVRDLHARARNAGDSVLDSPVNVRIIVAITVA